VFAFDDGGVRGLYRLYPAEMYGIVMAGQVPLLRMSYPFRSGVVESCLVLVVYRKLKYNRLLRLSVCFYTDFAIDIRLRATSCPFTIDRT